ncbi:MAG: ABC transporter permease [Hyphomicrobium sp.]|nr:ABC transporter permease [Hyphomicrobium sp.]
MLPRSAIRPGFLLVFGRELRWLKRRPLLVVLTTVLPLALMGLLMLVFSQGLATRLHIGVLDLDGSDLSRTIVRTVDATADDAVAVRVADLAEGRQKILSGEVSGLLMIPENLERDVFAGRRPEVVFFYNTQMLTTGNLVLRGVSAAVPSVAAGIRLSLRTAQGQPIEAARSSLSPIPVQTHPLFNPTMNYIYFLLAATLPTVLQIIIVTSSTYSAAMDFETNHRLRILRRLGGGLWPAFLGKIVPYTFVYLAVLGTADAVMFGVLGLPLHGSRGLLLLAGVLFMLSCQMLGTLLALVVHPMSSAIGIGALLTSPAFGFMGIGFPRMGMSMFAYSWGACLPGTWYLTARIDQIVRGTPADLSMKPILILAGFVVGLTGLVALKLESIRSATDRRRLSPPSAPPSAQMVEVAP